MFHIFIDGQMVVACCTQETADALVAAYAKMYRDSRCECRYVAVEMVPSA